MSLQGRATLAEISKPLHEELLGVSPAIVEARAMIQRLALTGMTVLVTGESGTGKDIAARALHRLSSRAERPFIKVNCPAIPEGILESELFGYERGAFTGARTSKPGRLELAHTGTIFLDEIAETSLAVQGKLLQLLDGEPVMRVGGVTPIQCDVRVVAATNQPLDVALKQGRIREQVYYRLSEVQVHLPPLRQRPEDIPVLAEHFNYHFTQKAGREYTPLPEESLAQMLEQPWRGNVRELGACVKKYITTGDPGTLLGERTEEGGIHRPPRLAPTALVSPTPVADSVVIPAEAPVSPTMLVAKPVVDTSAPLMSLKEAVRQAVESTERSLIEEALRRTLWNRRKAARMLKISYSSLLRRIDAYGLDNMQE